MPRYQDGGIDQLRSNFERLLLHLRAGDFAGVRSDWIEHRGWHSPNVEWCETCREMFIRIYESIGDR